MFSTMNMAGQIGNNEDLVGQLRFGHAGRLVRQLCWILPSIRVETDTPTLEGWSP